MPEQSKVGADAKTSQIPSGNMGLKGGQQHNNGTPGLPPQQVVPASNNYTQLPMLYQSNNGIHQYSYQQSVMQNQFYQQPPHHHQQQPQQQQQQHQQHQQQQVHHITQQISQEHPPHIQPQQHSQVNPGPLVPHLPLALTPVGQPHQQELVRASSNYQTPTRSVVPQQQSSAGSVMMSMGKHSSPSTLESAKKRQRKADHAFPGEEGDLELRNLAEKALEIPLEQVADQVKVVETEADSTVSTPMPNGKTMHIKADVNRERQRQIFGMTWLMRACDASLSSVVPRNRIYARYVGICAENGLKPLSPASFGKLVRIVFPSLTTRRLGMRGQSKYHYCGLKLIGDNGQSTVTSSGNTPIHSGHLMDPASFMPGTPYGSNSPSSLHSQASTPLLSNVTTATSISSITAFLNEHIPQDLKFTPDLLSLVNEKASNWDGPIDLPDIKPYLPSGTDSDVADILYGLYKSHCTSVFEAMRYVQLKKLYTLLSNFDASLTTPVLKLFSSPSMLNWVIACDTIMYKAIVKMLAKLALQEIPAPVIQQLKQVSVCFTEKLHESMKKMPDSLVKARLILSKKFAQLMSRLVRVAETGQSANNVLSHTLDRKLMADDWIKNVNVEQIASKELPCTGPNFKKAIEILQYQLPELLKKQLSVHDSFLVDWGLFIASLPEQFDDIPPRLFLLCTSALLTSALREISLAGGPGFGGWWVVRCWIDEWIGWCAELGGFLATSVEASPLLTGVSDLPSSHESVLQNEKTLEKPVDLLGGQFGELLQKPQSIAEPAIQATTQATATDGDNETDKA